MFDEIRGTKNEGVGYPLGSYFGRKRLGSIKSSDKPIIDDSLLSSYGSGVGEATTTPSTQWGGVWV
jgi:hypothetical protein